MGVIIGRWTNSVDDGIYWVWDGEVEHEDSTLFAVMERYLTRGETMEILKYTPKGGDELRSQIMVNERKAHKERNDT
jgi:hypothetical protein